MKPWSKKIYLIFLIPGVLLMVSSCGTHRQAAYRTSSGQAIRVEQKIDIPRQSDDTEKALLNEARQWIGTPYKYGGCDHNGVDCSGLIQSIFRNALNIKLPRNSGQQRDYCRNVKGTDYRPGDLLFYATGKDQGKVSHVGMYVGDGHMIHSGSKGVVIVDVNQPYFAAHYTGAGRVTAESKVSKPEPVMVTPIEEPVAIPEPVITYEVIKKPEAPRKVSDDPRSQVLNSLIEQKLDSIIGH